MARIVFENTGDAYELPDGSPIMGVCKEEGVPFACTEGICGTCIIVVSEGKENLSSFNQKESDFFGDEGKERLACQCKIKHGTVKIKY